MKTTEPTTRVCKCGITVETGKRHHCTMDNTIDIRINCGYCGISMVSATHYWVPENYQLPKVRQFNYKPICDGCVNDVLSMMYRKL